jgi:hypothetical protein
MKPAVQIREAIEQRITGVMKAADVHHISRR